MEHATTQGRLITYLDPLRECDNPASRVMEAESVARRQENYRVQFVFRSIASTSTFILTREERVFVIYLEQTDLASAMFSILY